MAELEQSCCSPASVDVIISNCVIDPSDGEPRVPAGAAYVLKPRGCFATSDVIADPSMDEETEVDIQASSGCIVGELTRDEFEHALAAVGLIDVETHRVHEHAGAAIVRANEPR